MFPLNVVAIEMQNCAVSDAWLTCAAKGMNYLLIPTLLIASILFAVGTWAGHRKGASFWSLGIFGLVIAIPGILFAVYYLKFLGEPVWFYQFRSIPFSELSASGAGFLAGLLHGRFSGSKRFSCIA